MDGLIRLISSGKEMPKTFEKSKFGLHAFSNIL